MRTSPCPAANARSAAGAAGWCAFLGALLTVVCVSLAAPAARSGAVPLVAAAPGTTPAPAPPPSAPLAPAPSASLPTPVSTLPLETKQQSAHISPYLGILCAIGFGVALLIMVTQFVLTRPGRKGRWTL